MQSTWSSKFKETNESVQRTSTPSSNSSKKKEKKDLHYSVAPLLPDSQGQLGGEGGLNYIFVSRTPTESLTKFQRQGRSLPQLRMSPPPQLPALAPPDPDLRWPCPPRARSKPPRSGLLLQRHGTSCRLFALVPSTDGQTTTTNLSEGLHKVQRVLCA